MGSSILASLSEAGGNEPELSAGGPLPPHLLSVRIVWERDPHIAICKWDAQTFRAATTLEAPIINNLRTERLTCCCRSIPVRNSLTWTIPTWFWWAATSIGPWRILGNFYARCCTGLVRGVLSTTSMIAPHCSAQEHAA
jgi:hypothetical protein